MSNMFFVLCIVAIACATAVLSDYFKSRAAREKHQANDETLGHLEALEERIRVLERIVTERKVDLKREIDRL